MDNKVPGLDKIKSTFNGDTGYGAEMLPEELSTAIIKRVFDLSWIRNSVPSVNMTTQTMKLPKITGGITMQGTSSNKNVAADESRQTTSEVELDMKTIIGNAPIDNKTTFYAVDTMMPSLMDDIVMSVLDTEEDVFINGDITTGVTNINGVYDATNFPNGYKSRDPKLELNGLRIFAQSGVTVNASGGYLTPSDINNALAGLGKYALTKSNILVLVSHSTAATIRSWEQLETVEKYGKDATILTGEIGKVLGTSVLQSSRISDTLDTAGVERDQSAGTSADNRTIVLVFNKTSPLIGNPAGAERKFNVKIDDQPTTDRIVLVPREDLAFANKYDEAICQIINVKIGTI